MGAVRLLRSLVLLFEQIDFLIVVQEHENRRRILAVQNYRQKKEKSVAQDAHFNSKFQKRLTDQQRREHEDHLRYFQVSAFWNIFKKVYRTLVLYVGSLLPMFWTSSDICVRSQGGPPSLYMLNYLCAVDSSISPMSATTACLLMASLASNPFSHLCYQAEARACKRFKSRRSSSTDFIQIAMEHVVPLPWCLPVEVWKFCCFCHLNPINN